MTNRHRAMAGACMFSAGLFIQIAVPAVSLADEPVCPGPVGPGPVGPGGLGPR